MASQTGLAERALWISITHEAGCWIAAVAVVAADTDYLTEFVRKGYCPLGRSWHIAVDVAGPGHKN